MSPTAQTTVAATLQRRPDALSGGVRLLPVTTPHGEFQVWTRRVGDSPRIKLLLLHGGPGATSEYFECFDSHLPAAGIELIHFDQLGSHRSSQPDVPALWELPRFVDEVEQLRVQLGLDAGNFFLLGHSWGGILATEYALAHGQHLKGLVISNMVSSIPAYNRYAKEVLMPGIPPAVLADIQALEASGDTANPRYMELLVPHHYEQHVLRMPAAQWPDPVQRAFAHLNQKVYVPMQGPSELGASGKLLNWDRTADLPKIIVPTLTIGAAHDTMEPAYMKAMAESMPNGRHLHCPNGSHMAMYDDPVVYIGGLIDFLLAVDAAES